MTMTLNPPADWCSATMGSVQGFLRALPPMVTEHQSARGFLVIVSVCAHGHGHGAHGLRRFGGNPEQRLALAVNSPEPAMMPPLPDQVEFGSQPFISAGFGLDRPGLGGRRFTPQDQ